MGEAERLLEAAQGLGLEAAWTSLGLQQEERTAFQSWLAAGRHAGMAYLGRTRAARLHPERAFPWAKSALLLAADYSYPDPGVPPGGLRVGRVARYAWTRDYHLSLGAAVDELARMARGLGLLARGYVDHGPLFETALARRAGLGWIGRNTLLIAEGIGSYRLLGVLLTSLAVDPPSPAPDRCGRCTACRVACPTGALDSLGLDARRCLSYWTIEHRGAWPLWVWGRVEGWLFGCDLCQTACPWNRFAEGRAAWRGFNPEPELAHPDLWDFLRLSGRAFARAYAGTAFLRPGRAAMVRNALAVLYSEGHGALEAYLEAAARDPSPRVRMAAAQGYFLLGQRRLVDDPDPAVAALARGLWEGERLA